MWTQLNRLLRYADGAGTLSSPLVEYVSAAAENGSDCGIDADDSDNLAIPFQLDEIEVPCGSLSSRMHCVMVGWNNPPSLECATRWVGRVFP